MKIKNDILELFDRKHNLEDKIKYFDNRINKKLKEYIPYLQKAVELYKKTQTNITKKYKIYQTCYDEDIHVYCPVEDCDIDFILIENDLIAVTLHEIDHEDETFETNILIPIDESKLEYVVDVWKNQFEERIKLERKKYDNEKKKQKEKEFERLKKELGK